MGTSNDTLGPFEKEGGVKRFDLTLWVFVVYLYGITLFGKGPTYIRIGPAYLGEILLFALLIWGHRRIGLRVAAKALPRTLRMVIICFLLWGMLRLLADLGSWGFDAIRDSAVCYYALFTFVGCAVAADDQRAAAFWSRLRFAWVLVIPWLILNAVTNEYFSQIQVFLNDAPMPLLSGSGSESLMHMGLGALLIVGVEGKSLVRNGVIASLLAGASFALVFGGYARGVKVAVGTVLVLCWVLQRRSEVSVFRKSQVKGIFTVALTVVIVLLAIKPSAILEGAQLVRFSDIEDVSGTAYWRQVWWLSLVQEVTTQAPIFGLGFGENLTQYNPLPAGGDEDWPLRSPHNISITIFSRMGLLGATIWVLILLLGVGGLWRILWKSRHTYQGKRSTYFQALFFASLVTAAFLNASFGVLMEGPVLGIWFWFALGFCWGHVRRLQCEPSANGEMERAIAHPI